MFIIADKPKDISSFWCIKICKKILPPKTKIGHSGTLDPMATGLLLLATDKDTKKLTQLIGLDKTYTTTIDFSKNSDTRDMQYREYFEQYPLQNKDNQVGIIKNGIFKQAPDQGTIQKIIDTLIPSSLLPLTPFSAKKKDGKKLYELARKGEIIQENREMKVHACKIRTYDFPLLELEIDVWSGTYIRSIGHYIWSKLGLWGILTNLRRTKIGQRDIEKLNLDKTESNLRYTIQNDLIV